MRHQGLMRYSSNTIWLMAMQGTRLLAGLFISLWIARYLGPEKFGIYNYALSIVTILAYLGAAGTNDYIIKELIKFPAEKLSLLNTAFYLRFLLGIFFTIILLGICYFSTVFNGSEILIIVATPVIFFQAFDVVDSFYRAEVSSRKTAISKITQIVISSAIRVYLIYTKAELISFIYVFTFESISYGLILYFSYRQHNQDFIFKPFSQEKIILIVKATWPLALISTITISLTRIDQIILGSLVSKDQLGYYSAAYRIIDILYIGPNILFTSLFTAIVNAKNSSEEIYYTRLKNFRRLLLAIGLISTVIVFFFSQSIIHILYSDTYLGSNEILKILIFNFIFLSNSIVTNTWYLIQNRTRELLLKYTLAFIFNVALNFYLISRIGVNGAAICSVLTNFLFFYLYELINPRTREFSRKTGIL